MSLKESLADLKSAAALLHDKVRLSAVSSHFSWLNDDELLIRKEPCQINLKKTPNAAERDDKAAQLGGHAETKEIFEILSKVSKKFGLCHLDRSMILLLHVNGYKSFSFWEIQVLITSVSSSDHPYLQFTFDFMTLTQNFNISYFEQKRKIYFSESLD